MNAKTDVFVQRHTCRFFALNTILAGQYASVNIMYTYYRLKINLAVASHVKEPYRGAEVIYNGLFNTVERYIFSFMLQHLYFQVPQVPIKHKAGRMCTLWELNSDLPSISRILYSLL
jgi:hypothetical protein